MLTLYNNRGVRIARKRGQLGKAHRDQPITGQDKPDRGRHRLIGFGGVDQGQAQIKRSIPSAQSAGALDLAEFIQARHGEAGRIFDQCGFTRLRLQHIDLHDFGRQPRPSGIGRRFSMPTPPPDFENTNCILLWGAIGCGCGCKHVPLGGNAPWYPRDQLDPSRYLRYWSFERIFSHAGRQLKPRHSLAAVSLGSGRKLRSRLAWQFHRVVAN